MSLNKNAFLRYRLIDQCLNDKFRRYNRDNLADKISLKIGYPVSKSSIDKDIRTLKIDFNAPIKFDKYKNCYFYTEEYSLFNIDINEDEEQAFKMSISILESLKDTKYVKSYKAVIDRLLSQTNDNSHIDIIQFEQPINQPDTNLFNYLYDAILNHTALEMNYEPYNKAEKTYTISPYLIKEYRNRFYLVARKHDKSNPILNFGIDRIKTVQKSTTKFIKPNDFKPHKYFNDSFGITRDSNDKPIILVLKFNALNIPYILSNPIHHSQRILERKDNYIIIQIKVFKSHELNMAMLSYGSGLEVISPTEYKNYLISEINKMKILYLKN